MTYVGSPYHVRHGDSFEPRVMEIVIDTQEHYVQSLCTDFISKHHFKVGSFSELAKCEFKANDQVRITLMLDSSDLANFKEIVGKSRRLMEDRGAHVSSIEVKGVGSDNQALHNDVGDEITSDLADDTVFDRFCDQEQLDKPTRDAGKGLCNFKD